MNHLDNLDIEWLQNEFNVKYSGNNVESYIDSITKYNIDPDFGISVPQCDVKQRTVHHLRIPSDKLAEIIQILKKEQQHLTLQERFPNIKEAWYNYMCMVTLTAYDQIDNI